MLPDFPIVQGHYQMTDSWGITLPLEFNRRIEDGSLVLWRTNPRITLWITVWDIPEKVTPDAHLQSLVNGISPDAFNQQTTTDKAKKTFSYNLREDSSNLALYGFVVCADSWVQAAMYMDDENNQDIVDKVFSSISYRK